MSIHDPESQPPHDPSAWSQRYEQAIHRYDGLDLSSQEAVVAVQEGIGEWRNLLPQRATRPDGTPAPANAWGLGAEKVVIHAIRSQLTASGQIELAQCLWAQMLDLLGIAKSLDECYVQTPFDPRAERRLVATARVQATALLTLLGTVHLDGPSPAFAARRRRRKNVVPPKRDRSGDQQLFDEWQAVRGEAGMTRKDFCASKNISLPEFIQTLDRVRKQRRPRQGWRK